MNLGQLRSALENDLQFFPQETEWKNSASQVINDAYLEVWQSARWDFSVKSYFFPLRAPQTLTLQAFVVGEKWLIKANTPTVLKSLDQQAILGQTVTIKDIKSGSLTEGLTWQHEVELIQTKDAANLAFYVSPDFSPYTIPLDSQGAPDGYTSTDQLEVKLAGDLYSLPFDCGDILGVVQRDDEKQGELAQISPWEERKQLLRRDLTGVPSYWILEPERSNLPPQNSPTLSLAGGGSIASGTVIKVFYTWYYAGRESGPSQTAQITTTAANQLVTVTFLDTFSDILGRSRRVYVAVGASSNIFYLAGEQIYPATLTYNITSISGQILLGQYTLYNSARTNPRKYIRFYPISDSSREVELQYQFIPPRLTTDNDCPLIPEIYQRLIVLKALLKLTGIRFSGEKAYINAAAEYQNLYRQASQRHLLKSSKRFIPRASGLPGENSPGSAYWPKPTWGG